MATQHDFLANLAEGAGAWKPRDYKAFVRLEKKGLAEFIPGSPPRWRVTDAVWGEVSYIFGHNDSVRAR